MDIQYSKKKKIAQQDPLVDGLVRAKGYLNERRQMFTIGVVIVALVVLGVVFYQQMRSAAIHRADESFGKAVLAYTANDMERATQLLTETANQHKGTPHASYSAFMLGTSFLREGRYEEALAWFEDAAGGAGANFIAAAALEGISASYEGLGDYSRAVEYLHRAFDDKRLAFRRPSMRWKLALLSRELAKTDDAVEFCEEIVSDSLAVTYHAKARNLLAALRAADKG